MGSLGFPMDHMEPPSPSCGWATTTATTTPSANRTRRRVNSSPWVGPPEDATLNRRGSPWVGNHSKSPKSGALIRRLGLGIDPKQARGIRRLGQEMALNSGARNSLPCKIPQKSSFFVIFGLATTVVACATQLQIEVSFLDFWRFQSILLLIYRF